MQERTNPWSEGMAVIWPKVNPYTIAKLVGNAGNIHISETGHWHVYWHKELGDGRKLQVHNGGSNGFPDIDAVKHQHERIILQYVGVSVDLPPQEENIAPSTNFVQITGNLQRLEIPGEAQSINEWIATLQRTSRDLPTIRNVGGLGEIRQSLRALLQGNLGRSINNYKRAAARALGESLEGERAKLLFGVNEAEAKLFLRAQEIVSITLGIMQRYNDLEKLQVHWNGTVSSLPGIYAGIAQLIENNYPQERLERRVSADIINERAGVFGKLAQLQGEPYKSKALKFINSRDLVFRLWEERNLEGFMGVLKKQALEAEVWRRWVKEECEGVDFGKYSLS